MNSDKKYLIIYHAHCLDGITAAAVAHRYLTEELAAPVDNIYYKSMNYEDDIEEITDLSTQFNIHAVYIVDFSFSLRELEFIAANVKEVYLYDHHASAFRNLCGEEYIVESTSREEFNLFGNVAVTLNNDESGASLCWRKMFYQELPMLVDCVKDYDLWRFKYSYTKPINKYLKLQNKTISNFFTLLEKFEDVDWVATVAVRQGEALLSYEDSLENDLIYQGTTPITISGIQGLTVNAPPTLASSIGNKLAATSKTFGATWWQAAEGEVKFSLRSIGDSCDVSKLAESMGGGGHKNAAGFTMVSPEYDSRNGITLWSNN